MVTKHEILVRTKYDENFIAFFVLCFLCAGFISADSVSPQQKRLIISENGSLVLVPSIDAPDFVDDSALEGLKKAVGHSLTYYSSLSPDTSFSFGQDRYSLKKMMETMEQLQTFLERSPYPVALNNFIHEDFLIYRSAGMKSHSDAQSPIIFSAYYEHSLDARLTPDRKYRYPIYGRPQDLVDVYLESFDARRKGERIVGRALEKNLVPYYSRKEIDSDNILAEHGLEIAWAKDPLDIVFLQIQGSGWLRIHQTTQTFHIRYAGDNGRPFRSIGSALIETGAIRKEEFSRAKMVKYIGNLSEKERQFVLNQNPRYIFFEIVSATHSTRGSLLVPLTSGRTIATDPKFYPPGALAWIQTEKPLLDHRGTSRVTKPVSRFVCNQDEGGAIKGAGRVDFFVGGGEDAERTAQKLWYPGELYFFVLKDESAAPRASPPVKKSSR